MLTTRTTRTTVLIFLSFTYRTAIITTGLDRTYNAHHFIFSFTFQFFVCSVWRTELATRSAFNCTLNTHYCIVSYRIYSTMQVKLKKYDKIKLY